MKDFNKLFSRSGLSDYYLNLAKEFNLLSIEDPFSEDEWASWEKLKRGLDGKTQLIGDDLTATNLSRLDQAIKIGAINGLIIKPNQIGTVSETLRVVKRAKDHNLKIVVSHRSEETMDDFIADLAVGIGADYLKAGCPTQQERLVKYNRLVEIESSLKLS